MTLRELVIAAGVITFLLLITVLPSHSQQAPCGPTGKVEADLKKQYGEVPAIAGINSTGAPMMIFANPDTGTFSVTVRRADKMTCIVSAGKNWTVIEQEKKGQSL